MPATVAVYGTLRKGDHANSLMGDSAYLGRDTVKGSLFNIGSFPGYRPEGEREVVVDLYQIGDDRVIDNLDRYEGYDENRRDMSLYTRERVVTKEGKKEVFIYVFNKDNCSECYPEIESGDWHHHGRD